MSHSKLLEDRKLVFTKAKELELDEFLIKLAKVTGRYKSVHIYFKERVVASYDTGNY